MSRLHLKVIRTNDVMRPLLNLATYTILDKLCIAVSDIFRHTLCFECIKIPQTSVVQRHRLISLDLSFCVWVIWPDWTVWNACTGRAA